MSETHNASPYKGLGQLTREQFLFYEMRTTAKLIAEGLEDSEVIKRIVDAKLSAAKLLSCDCRGRRRNKSTGRISNRHCSGSENYR